MLHIIVVFIATAAISFAGSLQIGPLNLAAMHATLTRGSRAGRMIGFGGCIPEFIYSSLALVAAAWLQQHKQLVAVLEWSIVPLLAALGVMNLLKKKKKEEHAENKIGHGIHFFKGFLISTLNPQMFPFWLSILIMLNGYAFFQVETIAEKTAFVLGTGAGEFVLILSVVAFTQRYRDFFMRKLDSWNINRVFGILFIALAAVQSAKLLLR